MEGSAKDLFIQVVGLSPQKAEETIKNANLSQKLVHVISLAQKHEGFNPSGDKGKLLYSLASNQKATQEHQELLTNYIVTGKIPTVPQLEAAAEYLRQNKAFNQQEFEVYAGIGVEVTAEQLNSTVSELISSEEAKIRETGWDNKGLVGNLLKKVKNIHKWANPVAAKDLIEEKLRALLGPKPSEEEMKEGKNVVVVPDVEPVKKEKLSACIGRELKSAQNSEELLKKHLEFTGGKVITRFPPEPNGYLHIGHAKAMRFNFKMAEESGGHTYLRFDDTNPDKESEEFIENIKRNLKWLGYTP